MAFFYTRLMVLFVLDVQTPALECNPRYIGIYAEHWRTERSGMIVKWNADSSITCKLEHSVDSADLERLSGPQGEMGHTQDISESPINCLPVD